MMQAHTLRELSVDWIWRKLRYRNAFLESHFLLERLDRLYAHSNAASSVDFGDRFVMASHRSDGVGIQAMHRIGIMHYAEKMGVKYLHLPFLDIAHREHDRRGRELRPMQWAREWEEFLNLGSGEANVLSASREMGRWPTAWALSRRRNSGEGKGDSRSFSVRSVPFESIRQPGGWTYTLDSRIIDRVRTRFEKGVGPRPQLKDANGVIDVAVHIRRGDVWQVVQQASTGVDEGHRVRYVSEAYYLGLLGRLQSALDGKAKRARFHIFTDGRREDFPGFRFKSETVAQIRSDQRVFVDEVIFHFEDDAFETLAQLCSAPILIPGKSAFSALAISLGRSIVIYDDFIFDLGVFSPLKTFMRGNSRCFPIHLLDEAINAFPAKA